MRGYNTTMKPEIQYPPHSKHTTLLCLLDRALSYWLNKLNLLDVTSWKFFIAQHVSNVITFILRSWWLYVGVLLCIRIPPYSSRTAPIHQYTPKHNNTPTYSHQLLMMNVITFETCWAIKNFHKVTSSWFSLFNTTLCLLMLFRRITVQRRG